MAPHSRTISMTCSARQARVLTKILSPVHQGYYRPYYRGYGYYRPYYGGYGNCRPYYGGCGGPAFYLAIPPVRIAIGGGGYWCSDEIGARDKKAPEGTPSGRFEESPTLAGEQLSRDFRYALCSNRVPTVEGHERAQIAASAAAPLNLIKKR